MTGGGDQGWRISKRRPRPPVKERWRDLELETETRPQVGGPGRASQEEEAPSGRDEPRPFALTPVGYFGAVVVVLAVLGLVLNFTLSWVILDFGDEEPDVLERDETREFMVEVDLFQPFLMGPEDYTHPLLDWPVGLMIAAIALGLGIAGLDVVSGLRGVLRRSLRMFLLGCVGFVGFLLTLTGMRWAGWSLGSHVSDSSSLFGADLTFTLGVPPWFNLFLGLVLLGGAGFWIRDRLRSLWRERLPGGRFGGQAVRFTSLTLLVAAGALSVLPLAPYAVMEDEGSSHHFNEGGMAGLASLDLDEDEVFAAAKALEVMRTMLWIVFYVALAAWIVAVADRSLGGWEPAAWGVQVYGLMIVPIVAACVFIVLFYVRLGESELFEVSVNHLPALTFGALLVLYWHYLKTMLLPVVKDPPGRAPSGPPRD